MTTVISVDKSVLLIDVGIKYVMLWIGHNPKCPHKSRPHSIDRSGNVLYINIPPESIEVCIRCVLLHNAPHLCTMQYVNM